MIKQLLDFFIRERLIVSIVIVAVVGLWVVRDEAGADGRDPQCGREPGDCADRMDWAIAEGRGRPDHLSALGCPAGGARARRAFAARACSVSASCR